MLSQIYNLINIRIDPLGARWLIALRARFRTSLSLSFIISYLEIVVSNAAGLPLTVAYLGFGKGGAKIRGSGGRKSPSGVQGRSPGRGFGGRSPPKAGAFVEFHIHNFDAT